MLEAYYTDVVMSHNVYQVFLVINFQQYFVDTVTILLINNYCKVSVSISMISNNKESFALYRKIIFLI